MERDFFDCKHTPDQTYTRDPCICGRELWPPRGRGRGESLLSPRRIDAKLRAADALHLRFGPQRMTYDAIARRLGYHSPASAWKAVHRTLALCNAIWRYEQEQQQQRQQRAKG